MAKTKKIAVIGFGNIGTGVVRLLYEKGIAGLELVRVVDVDLKESALLSFRRAISPRTGGRQLVTPK